MNPKNLTETDEFGFIPDDYQARTRKRKSKQIKITLEQMKAKMDDLAVIKENKLNKVAKNKGDRDKRHREQFVILERQYLPNLFTLKRLRGPMLLYLYLWCHVNRNPYEEWANLGKYFIEGYLATARTQKWTAKDLEVPQTSIGYWFNILEQEGLIIKVGVENIKIGKAIESVPIFSLGELKIVDGYSQELWYHEVL